jgi:hypothetical protein
MLNMDIASPFSTAVPSSVKVMIFMALGEVFYVTKADRLIKLPSWQVEHQQHPAPEQSRAL